MTAETIAAAKTAAATHPVDEKLPMPQLVTYGMQHVLAFYAGAVLVPILVAGGLGLSTEQLIHLINADLFTCGIASLIQSVGIGRSIGVRLPLLQGVTFTAVSPMIAIGMAAGGGTDGLLAIYGAVIVAGIATFLVAPYFARLVRFFPPVVTGTVILIIGIALLPVAANDVVEGMGPNAIQNPVLAKNMAYALGTLLLIVFIQRFFRGFLATVAVLIGLVVGTLVAWALGDAKFDAVASSPLVGYTAPFYFGWPTFSFTAIVSMCVVMLITMVETTGDVYATGEIVRKRIRRDDIARAIRADGLATTLGGVLNSFPYTCFAENVGLVRLTQVRSRWVVAMAGVIMIVLGSLPKAAAIVAGIPHPVLGGAALAMFRGGGRGRRADADQGGFQRPSQCGHRRYQPGSGDAGDGAAVCIRGGAAMGEHPVRQRHHAGRADCDPAERAVHAPGRQPAHRCSRQARRRARGTGAGQRDALPRIHRHLRPPGAGRALGARTGLCASALCRHQRAALGIPGRAAHGQRIGATGTAQCLSGPGQRAHGRGLVCGLA